MVGPTGLIAPRGSQLLKMANPILARLQEAGILNKWEMDYHFIERLQKAYNGYGHLMGAQAQTKLEALSLSSYRSLFYIYFAGVLLGFLSFISEIVSKFEYN